MAGKVTNVGLAPADVAQRCIKKLGKVPRGIRLNNGGNIERGPKLWVGELRDPTNPKRYDERFCAFERPEDGIRAIAALIMVYIDKKRAGDGSPIDSCDDIVARWAPSTENNTRAYADQLAKALHVRANENVNFYDWDNIKALVCGLVQHENGVMPYDDDAIESGILRAGFKRPAEVVVAERQQDKTVATVGTAAAAATTVVSGVIAALPSISEAYRQGVSSSSALAEIAPWLPVAFGAVAAGAVVILVARNARLARLSGSTTS